MLTAAGNISSKVAPGRTWKRRMRIERIARLSCQVPPPTDDEIAISQGVTKQYVSMLRRTPEYVSILTTIRTGIVGQMDRQLFENIEENQDIIKSFIPEAMLALYETITDRTNPALRLRAAESLLDREGTLAKISKTEIKKKVEFNFDGHEELATDLLAALKGNTSTPLDLDEAGISSFTKTALSDEDKEKLQASLDLIESIDAPATSMVQ